MKSRRRSLFTLPSPWIAVAVGALCIAYVQISDTATVPTVETPTSSSTTTTSATTTTTSGSSPTTISSLKRNRISSLRTSTPVRPQIEQQAGRMKASDIKACISKAFCEVNSASKMPNYAVNQEFFDIMSQIQGLSREADVDSGSISVEYDEDDDDDYSSEESSSERPRGYPPPPPPSYRNYRFGRKYRIGGSSNATTTTERPSLNSTAMANNTTSTVTPLKVKGSKKKSSGGNKAKKVDKKKLKVKTMKKYVNGTFITVPKRRRTRLETADEKAQREAYLTRKQREMGQVNDLAALIRISADIGLTLRNPHKCRTLFNKCTMSHEQIVDLFNQTLLAVTTPASSDSESANIVETSPKISRPKVSIAKTTTTTSTTTTTTTARVPSTTSTTTTTTLAPSTTTVDDGNRSSKSRHDFSDEDVEYLTDTEIQPVHTYQLFVNDAPEDSVRTAEEINNVQETFKKYANAFPSETNLQSDLPALRKAKKGKKKSVKGRRGSSEEDDDDEDSMSSEKKSGFRIEYPYPGYRINEKEGDSAEPGSVAKESAEAQELPPLVKKVKPSKPPSKEDEDDEEDDEESEESVEDAVEDAKDIAKGIKTTTKKVPASPPVPQDDDQSSSEEEEEEAADDEQSPPPWTPVYQMYMKDKQKDGQKKKQKGPYKGGDQLYHDSAPHRGTSSSSSSSSKKKPWPQPQAQQDSQEINISGIPPSHSHHSHSHHDEQEQDNQEPDSHEMPYGDAPYGHYPPYPGAQEDPNQSEQKPGIFQSIMKWFTGSKTEDQTQQDDNPYGAPIPGGYSSQQQQGGGYHSQQQGGSYQAGAPWPTQPDPGNVAHYQHQNVPNRYRQTDSSEEEEDEEDDMEDDRYNKKRKNKRRKYSGRSDSIISSGLKKKTSAKKSSPLPPVVIAPKESKPSDGGLTGPPAKGKGAKAENIRTKKAAIKPKKEVTKPLKKETPKPTPTSTPSPPKYFTESMEEDVFSSEELYRKQQAAKSDLNKENSANIVKKQSEAPAVTEPSFPSYLESKKDQRLKDDGSLLFGFESLSSQLNATPEDLPMDAGKKKGGYKVTKTNKKKKVSRQPVKFNAKDDDSPEDKDEFLRKKK